MIRKPDGQPLVVSKMSLTRWVISTTSAWSRHSLPSAVIAGDQACLGISIRTLAMSTVSR